MIYNFLSYRPYLESKLGSKGRRTGARKRLAEHLKVHTTFVSQVLLSKAELSLEQAEGCNDFLGHDENQAEYFLALVMKDRAGTQSLEARFQKKVDEMRSQFLNIKSRVKTDIEVTPLDQSEFYSSFLYGAIHVLTSVPGFQTREAIAKKLNLSLLEAQPMFDFLIRLNVIEEKNGKLSTGQNVVHLGRDSSLIKQHHTNWRLHTLTTLDRINEQDLHYSGIMSISRKDAYKIKESILANFQENVKIVAESDVEAGFVYNFDFYEF